MAYNKSKLVANAQKLLHQGKVSQAIQEYVLYLKNEPKDQATLMPREISTSSPISITRNR